MKRKLLARRPSPAMVVALLALFSSLVGGAAAAALITGGDIKNGSITHKDIKTAGVIAKDIKQGAVRTKQVKDGSLLSADFMAGQLPAGPKGDTGDPGPKGDTGDPGAKGDTGAPGSALAFARVHADGTIDAAGSKNVTAANVYKSGAQTGVYCFKGLGFTPKNAVVTPYVNTIDPNQPAVATVGMSEIAGGFCNQLDTQIGVFFFEPQTPTNAQSRPDQEFFIQIN